MTVPESWDILNFFCQVAPPQYWSRFGGRSGFQRKGIFSLAVVVWMMMVQRLQSHGTLAEAVARLRLGEYRRLQLCPNCWLPARWRREMDRIVEYAAAYKLPKRQKRHSYPRAVWGTGYRFPSRTHEQK